MKVDHIAGSLVVVASVSGAIVGAPPAHAQVLNELRTDQVGNVNPDQYVELAGPPGASLDGVRVVVLGDSWKQLDSGVIEAVIDLSGHAVRADGLFLVARSTYTLLGAPDLTTDVRFETNDNLTFFLVRGFTGSLGQDLDLDDDGVLDVVPWAEELDRLALIKEHNPPEKTEFHYGPPLVGPDGPWPPSRAYRCPDRVGPWLMGRHELDDDDDSPGAPNYCGAPVADAGVPDAAWPVDAAAPDAAWPVDAGVPDAAWPIDAGTPDAATADAAVPADAGGATDAGPGVDASADAADPDPRPTDAGAGGDPGGSPDAGVTEGDHRPDGPLVGDGCGCGAAGAGVAVPLALVLAPLVALRRRRGSPASAPSRPA